MTATADHTKSTAFAGGRHRFASPHVREIPSRRASCPGSASAASDDPAAAEVTALIRAAGQGDSTAWEQLILRFSPMLRRVARSFRLSPSDVEDVVQDTWMALHANIDGLRNPGALPGWLATTARRRSLGLLHAAKRERPAYDVPPDVADHRTPENAALATERREVFLRAVGELPERQRRVVVALATRPDLDYQQLSTLLQMPIGSLGPTRARGLANLERDDELRLVHMSAG